MKSGKTALIFVLLGTLLFTIAVALSCAKDNTVNPAGTDPGTTPDSLSDSTTTPLDTGKTYTVTQDLGVGFADALDFSTDRDSVMITILNDSSGTLEWDIRYSAPWLHFDPISDTGEAFVWVRIDRDTMQPGIHRDTVTVVSNGGDTSFVVEVIISSDSSTHTILEYWPFAVGNSWVWYDPLVVYWWALEVIDSTVLDTFTLWHVTGEDSYGGTGEWWFTVANDRLMVLADSSYAHGLEGNPGTFVCPDVDCWNGSTRFSIFESEIQPGRGFDPYWRSAVQYVPGSMEELLDLYPVWYLGSMSDSQMICGDVDGCIAMREDRAAGGSIYTVFAPGWGPVIWDGWYLIKATIGDSTYGSVPDTLQAYHMAENKDTTDELLWWFLDDHGNYIYVMGYRESGLTIPNHIIFENDYGEVAGIVVFRPDFIPVMWATDSATISVRNITPDTTGGTDSTWDPTSAFHYVTRPGDTATTTVIHDIYPHTPYAVIESLQVLYNMRYDEMWYAMEDKGISTWEDLVAVALYADSNRAWWQSTAMFIGMGAAITAFELGTPDTPLAKSLRTAGLGIFIPSPAVEAAKKIAEYLKDEAMCKWCPKPGVPTVQMLQCQGVKAVLWYGQVCHSSYMYGKTATECVDLCKVTMKCFTNICMPRDVAVSDFEDVLWENNLELTPEEAWDLVKQNWDQIKP